MFFVTFRFQSNPKHSVEIVQTLQGITDKVKKIEGCTNVYVYKDIHDGNIFFLVEEWQKQRNLEEHTKSDLYAAILGTRVLLAKPLEIMFLEEN
jgi:quinol monooxygenase YgiN